MSSSAEGVLTICKKALEKDEMSPEERCKFLKRLQEIKITKEMLNKHQIHVLLGKLAKNKKGKYTKKVQQLASKIREEWKIILKGNTSVIEKPSREPVNNKENYKET